jgi:hypothetical protein
MSGIEGAALYAFHGGSRVMCRSASLRHGRRLRDPRPRGPWGNIIQTLECNGWVLGGSDFLHTAGDSQFKSYTKGD